MTTSADVVIQIGAYIELHFSLSLTNGDVIDSNFDGKPAAFKLGDGNMLPGFESVLLGFKSGDELEETIAADNAFGQPNPDNCQRFAIAKFQHLIDDELMPTEVGSVVSFKDPGGFDIPGVIKAIDSDAVTVDFNHPLAGKDIVFKAKIISVLEPEQQPLEIKL